MVNELGLLMLNSLTLVMGADVSKRLTPESAKLEVLPFEVNVRDNAQTIAQKRQGVLNLIKQHNADQTPTMQKYAPNSLPHYGGAMSSSAPQQHRVGDIVYVKGQKMQIADAKGNLRPVR